MNAVTVDFRDIDEPAWLGKAEDFALEALKLLGVDAWDLSLLFCGDSFIAALNGEYRHKEGPTDVLSFEQREWYDAGSEKRFLAGDIVISLDALGRNADDFNVSAGDELKRLIVHGILHLSGLDHVGTDPAEPMLAEQEKMLQTLAEERIL